MDGREGGEAAQSCEHYASPSGNDRRRFYGTIWFVVPLVIAHQAHMGLLGIGLGMFDFAIVALGFLLGNLADKSNKRALVFFGLLLFSLRACF